MLILVLGKGKTGSLVAEVARERGHGVRALDIDENRHASRSPRRTLAGVDVVIDFTAPRPRWKTCARCWRSAGASSSAPPAGTRSSPT
jgi:UDP-N-acetylmuramoylalanine-D-glutamate ligase